MKKGEQCQYGKECKFSHDRNRFDDQGRPKLTKKAIAAARAMVAAADAITPPGDGADGAGATAPEGKKPRRRRQKSNAFALAGGADDGQYEDDGYWYQDFDEYASDPMTLKGPPAAVRTEQNALVSARVDLGQTLAQAQQALERTKTPVSARVAPGATDGAPVASLARRERLKRKPLPELKT